MALKTSTTARLLTTVLKGAGAAALALALSAAPAGAQTYIFQPAPDAPENDRLWQDGANWFDPELELTFVPNVKYNESGLIDNGATAVLTVDSPNDITSDASVVTPGGVTVANGGLDIRDTGALFVTQANDSAGNMSIGGAGTGVLTVNPGGVLQVDGNLSVTNNPANIVTVGGASGATASVTAGAAALGGTTHLYPNADFTTTSGGVSFSGSSVYQVEVDGPASNGFISAQGPVALGGALELNFTGVSPTGGDSWTILEGASVNGTFSSVSSNASLAFNEALAVSQVDAGGGRQAVQAAVEEVLVLEVNRDTGTATITHPGASSIELDGYYVGSNSGLLSDSPAVWQSLTESGELGDDWVETAQTSSNIGELKISGDATFGGNVELGAIYEAFGGDFGQAEDLEFRYRRSDGVEFPGVVRYTGDAVNSLVLQVDPAGSGDAYLRNASGTSVQIDAYEVLSDSGALDEEAWNSLEDQGATSNEWLEALDTTPNLIAEFDSEGFTTIASGESLNLGPLFTGGAQDLEFNFLMQGAEDGTSGVVIYEQFVDLPGIAGDFNDDGVVDTGDYVVWRDNLGADGLPNDNDLGTVGADHYDLWRSQYGATSAPPAAAAAPEPAASLLLALALGGAGVWRRRG